MNHSDFLKKCEAETLNYYEKCVKMIRFLDSSVKIIDFKTCIYQGERQNVGDVVHKLLNLKKEYIGSLSSGPWYKL